MTVYDKDGNIVYPFQWHNALRDSDLSQDMLYIPVSSGERLREMRDHERTLRSSRRGSRVMELVILGVLFLLAMLLFSVADLE